ncbi:MAG: hypothetical protein V4547_16475 [Bacteroidota bacterium]
MRNLLKFAIAFSVAITENDTEELGFEPTLDTFKKYFEIPDGETETSGFVKNENFKLEDVSEWFNQKEKIEAGTMKLVKPAADAAAAPKPAAAAAAPKVDAAAAKATAAATKAAADKAKADAKAAADKVKADSKAAVEKAKADAKKAKEDAKNANVELNQREKVYLMIRNEEAKGKAGLSRKDLQVAIMNSNPEFNAGAIWACFKHYDNKKQNAFDKEKILLEKKQPIVLYDFKMPEPKETKEQRDAAKAAAKAAADKVKADAKAAADAAKVAAKAAADKVKSDAAAAKAKAAADKAAAAKNKADEAAKAAAKVAADKAKADAAAAAKK